MYSKAIEEHPESIAIRRLLDLAKSRVEVLEGEKSMRNGRWREALDHFKMAIDVNPDPYDETVGHAYFRIGYLSWKQRDYAEAAKALKECLQILPNHRGSILLAVEISADLGDYEQASRMMEKLLLLYPGDKEVRNLKKRISGSIKGS